MSEGEFQADADARTDGRLDSEAAPEAGVARKLYALRVVVWSAAVTESETEPKTGAWLA